MTKLCPKCPNLQNRYRCLEKRIIRLIHLESPGEVWMAVSFTNVPEENQLHLARITIHLCRSA